MLHSEPKTLSKKMKEWASCKWNLCDACAVVLFFIAVGFRIHPGTLTIGHMLYCLDIMLWIIRVLDIFSVSKVLGPYVVMIGRMVGIKRAIEITITVVIKFYSTCIWRCHISRFHLQMQSLLLTTTKVSRKQFKGTR